MRGLVSRKSCRLLLRSSISPVSRVPTSRCGTGGRLTVGYCSSNNRSSICILRCRADLLITSWTIRCRASTASQAGRSFFVKHTRRLSSFVCNAVCVRENSVSPNTKSPVILWTVYRDLTVPMPCGWKLTRTENSVKRGL